MNDAVHTETLNGYRIEIHYDVDPSNPRDFDALGCQLVMSHGRRALPNDANIDFDAFSSWYAIAEELRANHDALFVIPIYGYEHTHIAFCVGTTRGLVDMQWDGGIAGLGYVTPENWETTQGTPWTGSEEQLLRARELIVSDVADYEAYINGWCYGYIVTDLRDGEEVDSCWDYLGNYEYALQEARNTVRYAVDNAEPKCNGDLDRVAGVIVHEHGACPVHAEVGVS